MSRQAFEAWVRTVDKSLSLHKVPDGGYKYPRTKSAWSAYKAATNAALEKAAQKVEPHRSTEAIEVIGGEDGLLMLRELAAEIRALKDEK